MLLPERFLRLSIACAVAFVPASRAGADSETVDGVTWQYSLADGAATVTKALGARGTVAIPSELGGCPVTSIGDNAFLMCSMLDGVTIPGTVTNIGAKAFLDCDRLPEVDIPAGVARIGPGAFEGCTGLARVAIPATVADIGGRAFGKCKGLQSIEVDGDNAHYADDGGVLFDKEGKTLLRYPAGRTGACAIPDGVEVIGDGAFEWCAGLTGVTIPGSVARIESGAFEWCGGLTEVSIPDSVEIIGDSAFSMCGALTNVTIGRGVASIGGFAFCRCGALRELVVPPNVKNLEDYAFFDLTGLERVTLSEGVEHIGEYAFCGCGSLTDVAIPASVESVDAYAFYACNNLTNIEVSAESAHFMDKDGVLFSRDMETLVAYPPGLSGAYAIPDGVKTVGEGAFYWVSGLTGVTIPDSVTYIGYEAFHYCHGLKFLALGNGVEGFGIDAFRDCTRLKAAYFPASMDGKMITGLRLPSGCTNVYYDATGSGKTVSSPVAVPKKWLAMHATAALAATEGARDWEAAATAVAANGVNAVWQCYLAGLEPADAEAAFTAEISFTDGKPVVESVDPDLGEERQYALRGRKDLADPAEEWGGMDAPGAEGYRFFRVSVSLP
jgi:hypothetical protein